MTRKIDVCVIGAGPAGLFAAIHAAWAGANVSIVESQNAPGHKLFITGGGRCNVTHAGTARDLVPAFAPYDRFLRFALHEVPPAYMIDFLESRGVPTHVYDDGCVFPTSEKSHEVRDLLVTEAEKAGVSFSLNRKVRSITNEGGGFLIDLSYDQIEAARVIIATGGMSYPRTGSTGDGYTIAKNLGHRIIPVRAALIPLVVAESWCADLAGTSVPKVILSSKDGGGRSRKEEGALVFTQDGLGGPAVLNLSRYVIENTPNKDHPVAIYVDLVPEKSAETLAEEFLQRCAQSSKKAVKNIVANYIPKRLAELLCQQADCADDLWACNLNKANRRKLLELMKALPLSVIGTRPLREATITRGGIDTQEVSPKTMESKLCPGLHFAGEILDLDAPCGGYNLQICWSTGALAGRAAGSGLTV